jgi:hypothetical protein
MSNWGVSSKTLVWNERDLERKLVDFKNYYNRHRTHDALDGIVANSPGTPRWFTATGTVTCLSFSSFFSSCPSFCRELALLQAASVAPPPVTIRLDH